LAQAFLAQAVYILTLYLVSLVSILPAGHRTTMSYGNLEDKIISEAIDDASRRIAALEAELPSVQISDPSSDFGRELLYCERLTASVAARHGRSAHPSCAKLAAQVRSIRAAVCRLPAASLPGTRSQGRSPAAPQVADRSTSSCASFLRPSFSTGSTSRMGCGCSLLRGS